MRRFWKWVVGVLIVLVGIVVWDPVWPYDPAKVDVAVRELEEPFVDVRMRVPELSADECSIWVTDQAGTVRCFLFDLEADAHFGALRTNTIAEPEWREIGAESVDDTRLRLCEILRDYRHLHRELAVGEAWMRGGVRSRVMRWLGGPIRGIYEWWERG